MITPVLILTETKSLLAQQVKNDSLMFNGVVKGINKGIKGRILLFYDMNDWFPADSGAIINIPLDSNGNFNFNLPDRSKPYKISFNIRGNENRKLFSGNFYVESGDKITINFVENKLGRSILFTGKGAEKYNLIVRLNSQFYKEYLKELSLLKLSSIKDSNLLNLKMDELAGILKEFKAKKTIEINSIKITPEIRSVINYEFGTYDNEWVFRTNQLYIKNPAYKKQIWQTYLSHHNEFYEKLGSQALYASFYLRCILNRDILELMITTQVDRVKLESLYKRVKENYLGLTRDWLIGYMFVNGGVDKLVAPYDLMLKDSLLREAQGLVELPYVKNALNKQMNNISRTNNVKVIDAEFVDLKGGKFILSSLKGKVYLIDTWFNGCVGCVQFHKIFEESIYGRIKENQNFVLLSINMDRTKERWISGIKSNRYTSDKYMNVWTGASTEHPFLKYYQIQKGAALMLVDTDGTILYQPIGYRKEELEEKIIAALKKVTSNL